MFRFKKLITCCAPLLIIGLNGCSNTAVLPEATTRSSLTTDVNEYIRKLEEMNTTDLQTHAHVMGFVPLDDRVTLMKKLISEFKKHCSSFTKPTSLPSNNSMISDEIPQNVKRTLSEGR